jgi:hypothetical protein
MTVKGDQLSVIFGYAEERRAFETLIEDLRAYIEKSGVEEGPIEGFVFKTTLQFEVARENGRIIAEIFNLQAFNAWSKEGADICLWKKDGSGYYSSSILKEGA